MSSWEKPIIRPHQRRKTPSFSSSLLEAIYHSIDESKEELEEEEEEEKHEEYKHVRNKKKNDQDEIVSLRRAILIEKWMESYKYTQSSGHFSSDSSSSTESSMFSSSETETRSINTLPRPTIQARRSEKVVTFSTETTTTPKCEGGGRFTRTKSKALKMVKQPISPGGKIANFLNSIFNSRNMKKNHHEDWRKSRSVNDSTTSSCLNKTPSSTSRSNKSKRSVRFCPVTVIVNEDCQPCGHKSIYKNEEPKHQYRGFYKDEDEDEDDGRSCASSDLFELENIGMIGHVHATRDGLPVYGTTSFKMNQAIARGLVM
ncbi:hypothetical protein R3W88_019634 [Solanum pinnatisectum]|uniref:Protein BIG GRAIN 1-like B n=1 Tax=Solanum pinnatisectum TaxID=50273 RepID=A0AAV9KNS8_9SOLN|nr:hypothetical protein R3W88_019634 [Solanum pinnatisectum]